MAEMKLLSGRMPESDRRIINDELKKKDKQITQLKADLAEANRLYKQAVSVNADKLEQMLSAVVHKENEQLKADLAKFGGHTSKCRSHFNDEDGYALECDCGFVEAKERWE